MDGPCLGPLSQPHRHSSVCSSTQPPPHFPCCPLRPKENGNYFTHTVSLWICFHPFPNISSSPLIRCKLTSGGKKKRKGKKKKKKVGFFFSPLTHFLVTGEIHYCMPLAVPSYQIYNFRCYMDALFEKSLTKSPGKALCSHGIAHVTDKSKNLVLHITYVVPVFQSFPGLLLESGETDWFSTYFKSTSSLTDTNG